MRALPKAFCVQRPPEGYADGMNNPLRGLIDTLDRYQRRHSWLGFPYGVVKKFGEDEAGSKAALIAYYGFFSLFPLLLVMATVLGFLLHDNSRLQNDVVHSVISRIPVIGDQIKVHALNGSALALAIGIVGALWGGMGVVRAGQAAMDTVWYVPRQARPNFVRSRLRALLLLLVLGAGVILSVVLTGLATAGTGHSAVTKALVLVISTGVNFGVFLAAMKLLTVADVSWSQLVPGAVIAALAGIALQALGSYIVNHTLVRADKTYGLFGTVIALLSWIYLQAQVLLFAAEVNPVRALHLWPRAVNAERPTDVDMRVLRDLVRTEQRRPDEDVDVEFRRVG
ncbi:MAG: YihY/virulence factor BrkB family protein [Acidimicrobiia bacterium]|nr:YihY/virulence factor BrkB family protein [Acidimicrobiia bacterium]